MGVWLSAAAAASIPAARFARGAFGLEPGEPGVAACSTDGLEPPIGVATGIHYAPICVGLFGPDEDYTGFSSGMNNTARLQGVAERDEILCMDAFVEAHGDAEAFGEERQAAVKNVAAPLRFRPLS